MEEGDLIELDVENRKIAIVGIRGERKTPEEIDAVLAERKAGWKVTSAWLMCLFINFFIKKFTKFYDNVQKYTIYQK